MDRALNAAVLTAAAGELANLPSTDELQRLIADAELSLINGRLAIDEEAVGTGWLLFGVACAAETLTWADRVSAFRVSGHVLDLASRIEDAPASERVEAAFAAQVAYRRGELEPNAVAVLRRIEPTLLQSRDGGTDWWSTLAIEAASRTLTLNTYDTYAWIRERRAGFARLRARAAADTLKGTIFGPAVEVVEACAALLRVLLYNDDRAEEAFERHLTALTAAGAHAALGERWVAAQTLMAGREMIAASSWRCLTSRVPNAALRALTTTAPSVLTLWPPQRALLLAGDNTNPLNPDVRRSVVSIPTSAGKTLVAQIIVLAELASTETPVCFVAPQRSLVKEIRRSLIPRVRALQRTLGREGADFDESVGDAVTVDVMTPERFARMLRVEPTELLARYRLFVFDEVHLVGDRSRGFGLEGSLTYLHYLTLNTDHRIVVMSAGIGNVAAFRSWLHAGDPGLGSVATWRGPRRLTAAYTTSARWDEGTHRVPTGRERKHRLLYPLDGRVAFSVPGAGLRAGRISNVGTLAFGRNEDGARGGKDGSYSTGHYDHVARLADALGGAGPVLSVTGTRRDARGLAQRIAGLSDTRDANSDLRESLTLQLGTEHPLPGLVARNVAYHHAGLPDEVLGQLEDAIRVGNLRHLVCTTTLTEGVNLPVHTVIVAEMRFDGSDVVLTGPRMLNALGRAGRAGMENEGWVVFAMTGDYAGDPATHLPSLDDLEVRSRIASDDFVGRLEEWEASRTATADAVFTADQPEALDDFVRFVWYVAACQEALTAPYDLPTVGRILSHTLGHSQQTPQTQALTSHFVSDILAEYERADATRRRIWGRDGTSVRTGRELDALADVLVAGTVLGTARQAPEDAVRLLARTGVLDALLELPEARRSKWEFKTSPRGDVIQVDTTAMLIAWTNAADLAEMAETFLSAIADREFRIEILVDRVSGTFGHALPWLLASLLERANATLAQADAALICPSLPKLIRCGVASDDAVRLVELGLRSRRLASEIVSDAHQRGAFGDALVPWLGDQPMQTWLNEARVSDLRDIREVVGSDASVRLSRLLAGEEAVIDVGLASDVPRRADVRVEMIAPDFEVARVQLEDGSEAPLGARDQSDLLGVLRAGVEVDGVLDRSGLRLSVRRQ